MTRSSRMEESVCRIFMEAAFKLSGVLSADMFFLMQTADGKRRFAGQENFVDDFVSGDLRFKHSDVHLRFYDDDVVDRDLDDRGGDNVDDDDGENDEFDDDVEKGESKATLSDVSDDGTLFSNDGVVGRSELKRKASVGPLEAEPPAEKASRKMAKASRKKTSAASGGEKPPPHPDRAGSSSSSKRRQSADKTISENLQVKNVVESPAGKKASPTAAATATSSPTGAPKTAEASSASAAASGPSSVILRNLPERMADANIKSKLEYLLKKFGGRLREVQIIHKNPKMPKQRYGIAVCDSRTQAQKLVNLTRDLGFRAKLNFDAGFCAEVIHKFNETDPRATRTLRVSNIHCDVGKAELRELFEPFGEIFSLELRHSHNEKGVSVGMAFIQYPQVENAVKAREKLIGQKIKNYPLLIGFVKSVKTDCLILNNIDTSGVHNMKNRFGTLNDVYVKKDKRQALLFFRDVECACKALSLIWQKKLAGPQVQMDFASVDLQDDFLGKSDAAASRNGAGCSSGAGGNDDAPAEKVNLVRLDDGKGIAVEKVLAEDFDGGITVEDGASDISDDEMEEVADADGAGGSALEGGGPKIIRTSTTTTTTTFNDVDDDAAAVSGDGNDAAEEKTTTITGEEAEGNEKKPQRLFVGNLGAEVTEDDIRTEFGAFGEIDEVEMSPDEGGYCFVRFRDDTAHARAMDAMNGKTLGDKEMLICMD